MKIDTLPIHYRYATYILWRRIDFKVQYAIRSTIAILRITAYCNDTQYAYTTLCGAYRRRIDTVLLQHFPSSKLMQLLFVQITQGSVNNGTSRWIPSPVECPEGNLPGGRPYLHHWHCKKGGKRPSISWHPVHCQELSSFSKFLGTADTGINETDIDMDGRGERWHHSNRIDGKVQNEPPSSRPLHNFLYIVFYHFVIEGEVDMHINHNKCRWWCSDNMDRLKQGHELHCW